MTAFQKGMTILGILLIFGYFFRWHRPDMTIVYPDSCVFLIDEIFARSMQLEIKTFIDIAYKKNKNPAYLLPKIEICFPAIQSTVIDMQNPEYLNFTIQAYQPIFLLNNQHVVCQHGHIIDRLIFSHDTLAKLENIYFDGELSSKNIDRLLQFFQKLTDSVLQNFSVRWIDQHVIWLDQKQDQNLSLLVGYEHVPTLQDIEQCQNLWRQILNQPCQDKRSKPCKNNFRWVCDLRFDQQIIFFSTK